VPKWSNTIENKLFELSKFLLLLDVTEHVEHETSQTCFNNTELNLKTQCFLQNVLTNIGSSCIFLFVMHCRKICFW
jgi:hypothetical protein